MGLFGKSKEELKAHTQQDILNGLRKKSKKLNKL